MQKKRSWLRTIASGALGLLLAFVALRFLEWRSATEGASPERMAVWTAPVPEQGNAFAQFWFAGLDVPESELANRLESDARLAKRLATEGTVLTEPIATSGQPALRPWPLLDAEVACAFPEMECIAKARTLRLPLRADLKRQERALAAANALLSAETVVAPAPGYLALNLRTWPGGTAVLNQIALDFATGQEDVAQQTLCRHVAQWRKLGQATPHATVRGLANTMVGHAISLFAEMRAELPEDAPMSSACRNAFRLQGAAELSLCTVAGGEWRVTDGWARAANTRPLVGSLTDRARILWQRGAIQPEHTSTRLSKLLEEGLCEHSTTDDFMVGIACNHTEQLMDPGGCDLIRGAAQLPVRLFPSEVNLDWQLRVLDIALGWSKDAFEAERETRIRAVLSAARLPPDTLGFDLDRRTIGVQWFGDPNGRRWEIFLPGTYAPKPAAATTPSS